MIKVPFVDLKAQYATLQKEMDAAVIGTLQSAYFIGGPQLEEFERQFADFCKSKFAVGIGNGTDSITLAVRAAGLKPGDEVLVPANSFFASAEAVTNAGATPVFVDVDPCTFHMRLDLAEAAITPRTRAILPVHLYGRAMDLSGFVALAKERDLVLIEDCAQAHGAEIHGERIGESGRLVSYSFYPGKNLGAYGDGGAVTTNDPSLAQKLRVLREHGSATKYVHDVVGWNSRLDALQAAVLSVKLPHLETWNRMRNANARYLAKGLEGCATLAPEIPDNPAEHVFHLFVVRTTEREKLQAFLTENDIQSGIHYPTPLHLTGAYRDASAGLGSKPATEALSHQILSLPMFPELTHEQLDHVLKTIRDFERKYNPTTVSMSTGS